MKQKLALEIFNKVLADISRGEAPDLTPRQSVLLVRICLADTPQSVKELADAAGATRASTGRAIDILDAHGFVVRRRDPHERRNIVVVPTSEGMAFLSAVADRVTAMELEAAAQGAA